MVLTAQKLVGRQEEALKRAFRYLHDDMSAWSAPRSSVDCLPGLIPRRCSFCNLWRFFLENGISGKLAARLFGRYRQPARRNARADRPRQVYNLASRRLSDVVLAYISHRILALVR